MFVTGLSLAGSTLAEAVDRAASSTAAVHVLAGNVWRSTTWGDVAGRAQRGADYLRQHGVGRGARVAVLGDTTLEIVTAILAGWVSGAAVSVLPVPRRADNLAASLQRSIRQLAPDILIVDQIFAPHVTSLDLSMLVTHAVDVFNASGRSYDGSDVETTDPAIVQLTSGTTGEPRGAVISHGAVSANVTGAVRRAEIGSGDRFFSWLPLFHDMGLTGTLALPLSFGIELALMSPTKFAASPRSWLEGASDHSSTVLAAPNFAFGVVARLATAGRAIDLSQVRLAFNGAEPVSAATTGAFLRSTAHLGFRSKSMYPVYGLAEATLAVTFPTPGIGARFVTVDSENAPTCAVLGTPIDGVEIEVRRADGAIAGVGCIGDLFVRSSSLMAGYLGDLKATEAVLTNGWLRTGDLASIIGGELVVVGRSKDLIIIAGRNLYPHEIEEIAAGTTGVRKGGVAAFGVPGTSTENLVVVAESRDASRVNPATIAAAVQAGCGVNPRVVIVPPGSLPKTTSGKLQRGLARTAYLSGAFDRRTKS